MNRTAIGSSFLALFAAGGLVAQTPPTDATKEPQVGPIEALVASVRKAEAGLRSLDATLRTSGRLPGGVQVTTRGRLCVARATRAGEPDRLFSELDYAFGEGLTGRSVSVRTADGIRWYEEDPAFGAVFLQIEPAVVADLEWAGTVLARQDLPGMGDARSQAPLGSALLAEVAQSFDLTIAADTRSGDDRGQWVRGARKPGIDAQDAELPLADRVELFVRDHDHAVLVGRYFVGEDIVQEIVVESLRVDVELPAETFTIDGRGLRVRDARTFQPMAEQIEQTIAAAEARAGEGVLRPSRR